MDQDQQKKDFAIMDYVYSLNLKINHEKAFRDRDSGFVMVQQWLYQ
jgi:hypothetical protein